MTKSEIIEELKRCKGNQEALKFAVSVVSKLETGCNSCKYFHTDLIKFPCSLCFGTKCHEYWEFDEREVKWVVKE